MPGELVLPIQEYHDDSQIHTFEIGTLGTALATQNFPLMFADRNMVLDHAAVRVGSLAADAGAGTQVIRIKRVPDGSAITVAGTVVTQDLQLTTGAPGVVTANTYTPFTIFDGSTTALTPATNLMQNYVAATPPVFPRADAPELLVLDAQVVTEIIDTAATGLFLQLRFRSVVR